MRLLGGQKTIYMTDIFIKKGHLGIDVQREENATIQPTTYKTRREALEKKPILLTP